MNVYEIGSAIRLSAAFNDLSGNPVDPTTVTFRVKLPDASVVVNVVDVVRDGVGLYHYDYTPAQIGKYFYRFEGSGMAVGAAENELRVKASNVVC